MSKAVELETNLVGIAGEYYVAAELTHRGFIAAISLRNSQGIDIIASTTDGRLAFSIQVKTSSGRDPKWIVSKKAEMSSSPGHFYVFVLLDKPGQRPKFFIVPSKAVAQFVTQDHAKWLASPKSDGTPRRDTTMRSFRDPNLKYFEAWDQLMMLRRC